MKNILLIYAHPSPMRSRLNRYLCEEAATLQHVEVRDLYELYPNLHIDVHKEQEALRKADVLIFQFPVFWFSSPSILKEWQDTVLTSKFAYGKGEQALQGKDFMIAVTAGGSSTSYTKEGPHGDAVETYLFPFDQTARFCGMRPLAPFIVLGANDLSLQQKEQSIEHYIQRLNALGEGDGHG